MSLNYKTFNFYLNFEEKIYFKSTPTIIMRSVLGMELRRVCCILRQNICSECLLKYKCAYSRLFESHISKEDKNYIGINRTTHPFVHSIEKVENGYSRYIYNLTLLGEAVSYFPYIFIALKNAGEKGIFKSRTKYFIQEVKHKDNIVWKGNNSFNLSAPLQIWECGKPTYKSQKTIEIKLATPFRLKKNGHYARTIGMEDILLSAKRRIKVLTSLYGQESPDFFIDIDNIRKKEIDREINWIDNSYYSSRQNERIKLGGFTGKITAEGIFSDYELSLLNAAQLFNIGKNISFGLGKIFIKTGEKSE